MMISWYVSSSLISPHPNTSPLCIHAYDLPFYQLIKAANNLTPCGRSIPEQVKKNALAEIFNIMVSKQRELESVLANTVSQDDPLFNKLRELLAGGAIPAAD